MNESVEKAKRLAELQKRLAAKTDLINFLPKDKKGLNVEQHPSLVALYQKEQPYTEKSQPEGKSPSSISSASRMLNRAAVLPKPLFSTTKANLKMGGRVQPGSKIILDTLKKLESPPIQKSEVVGDKKDKDENTKKNPYLQDMMSLSIPRKRAAGMGGKKFKFIQKGKFISEANKLRKLAYINELRQSIDESTKKKGIDIDLISDAIIRREPVAEVEWWDEQYLPRKSYETQGSQDISYECIGKFVFHPAPIPSFVESKPVPIRPVMLTKKEQKKLRRQARQERQKEKREMIRLGLLPPEEPKLKMTNYMKVLGTDALQEPTKAEALVRSQIQKRLEKHEKTNQDRKLDEVQKREKKRTKLLKDLHSGLVNVVAFRIKELKKPQWIFKIDRNARQNFLNGCLMMTPQANLVIVEGGKKSIRKYTKLLLHRIKWNEDVENMNDDDHDELKSHMMTDFCKLIWQGTEAKAKFNRFEVKTLASELMANEYLKEIGFEYLWSLAKSMDSVALASVDFGEEFDHYYPGHSTSDTESNQIRVDESNKRMSVDPEIN